MSSSSSIHSDSEGPKLDQASAPKKTNVAAFDPMLKKTLVLDYVKRWIQVQGYEKTPEDLEAVQRIRSARRSVNIRDFFLYVPAFYFLTARFEAHPHYPLQHALFGTVHKYLRFGFNPPKTAFFRWSVLLGLFQLHATSIAKVQIDYQTEVLAQLNTPLGRETRYLVEKYVPEGTVKGFNKLSLETDKGLMQEDQKLYPKHGDELKSEDQLRFWGAQEPAKQSGQQQQQKGSGSEDELHSLLGGHGEHGAEPEPRRGDVHLATQRVGHRGVSHRRREELDDPFAQKEKQELHQGSKQVSPGTKLVMLQRIALSQVAIIIAHAHQHAHPEINENKRWVDLHKMINRAGPMAHEYFTPGEDTREFLQTVCKILIIGAGGLGCDLVKNLALSGFKDIHIIDMDTIDLTNLNRQFLFRNKDVGKSKAETAARFINERVPGVKVTPHHAAIQDMDENFYKQFNIIICGLDSIQARRWINSTLVSLVQTTEDGSIDESTAIPYIDGGTEGFKGQARVIIPMKTSCYECTMDLFTEDQNFPMCTIKNTPRLPEHCIQYALVVEWDKQKGKQSIGDDEPVDGDNPTHIKWIYEVAKARADTFGIQGVTYRLTQGVVKRIIPAIASTNAIIASACTNESLKLATLMSRQMDDWMTFAGNEGIYSFTYKNERKEGCPVCGQPKFSMTVSRSTTLAELRDKFAEHPKMKFTHSSVRSDERLLYMAKTPALEKQTAANLPKTLVELGITDGSAVYVTDYKVLATEFNITIRYED